MSHWEPVFRVESAQRGDTHIVRIRGELDLAGCPDLERALNVAERSDADQIFLDLEELTFMSVRGATVIYIASRRSARNGSRLRITRGDWPVTRAFEAMGIDGLLPFIDASLVPNFEDLHRRAEPVQQRRDSGRVAAGSASA